MNKHLTLLLLAITFLTFFYLGKHPISPWDEARNGVNAIEMLNNKDWVNFVFFSLLIFTLGWQVYNFSNPKNKPSFIVENEKEISGANMVFQSGKNKF